MAEEETTSEEESTGETEAVEETVEDTKVTPDDDWKAKARKHEKSAKQVRQELEAAQAKLKEYEDRDKTDAEKAEEARKALEDRASKAEAELLRLKVASKAKLPPELAERLRGDTEEELEADAERLAELVKTDEGPSVDTDAGKGEATSGEQSFNDIIRGASVRD